MEISRLAWIRIGMYACQCRVYASMHTEHRYAYVVCIPNIAIHTWYAYPTLLCICGMHTQYCCACVVCMPEFTPRCYAYCHSSQFGMLWYAQLNTSNKPSLSLKGPVTVRCIRMVYCLRGPILKSASWEIHWMLRPLSSRKTQRETELNSDKPVRLRSECT